MHTRKSPLARAFASLGSVQFTMVLLLVGVVAMTAGTLIEKDAGAAAAKSSVYHTAWFDLFLLLIAVNLTVAVINRFPLKRTQWSFVLTHFSIVLLLLGAWISRHWGFEGSVVVGEGSTTSTLILDSRELVVGDGPGSLHIPIDSPRSGAALAAATDTTPSLTCLDLRPDSVVTTKLVDRPGGTPGLALRLSHSGMEFPANLLVDRPEALAVDLGPVAVEIRRIRTEEDLRDQLRAAPSATNTLSIRLADGTSVPLDVAQNLGREVEIAPGMTAKITAAYDCARVVDGTLTEVEGGNRNPAAQVEIRSGDVLDVHTAFALFPDFNIAKQGGPKSLVSAVRLESVEDASRPKALFLVGPGNSLFAQGLGPDGRSEGKAIAPGESTSLGRWSILVDQFRPEANLQLVAAPPAKGQQGSACLQLAVGEGSARQVTWIPLGYRQTLEVDGTPLLLGFQRRQDQLPFAVRLREFEVGYYPGSNRPSSYESHITLSDTSGRTASLSTVVAMNRPTDYLGFRLFQQSYVLGESGSPDTTILSVSHDPGVPLVYVSFVLLILGVGWYLLGGSDRTRHHHLLPRAQSSDAPSEPTPSSLSRKSPMPAKRSTPSPKKAAVSALFLLAFLPGRPAHAQQQTPVPVEATASWAIQFEGRIKPLETAAREIFLSLSGKTSLDGMDPMELFWAYHFAPQSVSSSNHIRVDSRILKHELGIPLSTRRISFDQLMGDDAFRRVVEAAVQARDADEALSPLQEDALAAYSKMEMLASVISGSILTVVPSQEPGGAWRSPNPLQASSVEAESRVFQGFQALSAAYGKGDTGAFRAAAEELTSSLRAVSPIAYPSVASIDREMLYNRLGAFGKAWVAYLLGFLLLLVRGGGKERGRLYWAAMACLFAGIALHITGFGLRWAIAGRAPVSDMYESLVFMSLGGAVIGTALELFQPKAFFGMAAGVTGFLALLFAEKLPVDSSINPLVPVLANTSWLSIHVMTIMLSYSAFTLAMVLGHFVLFVQLRHPGRSEKLRSLSSLLYRTLQIGLLFLAAGIAFGAIWANRSWGRYWGWDPKETWSLITFFVYLALIHARFAGWLHHFGTAVWTILCFLSVVMTYYGVNFLLGTGLHAYGFAQGGSIWVISYLVGEALVIAAATWRYRSMGSLGGHRATPVAEAPAH